MQWIDIVILAILAISTLVSAYRGFIKEILSLVAWLIAFFVASNFYEPMAKLFTFTDEPCRILDFRSSVCRSNFNRFAAAVFI